MRKVLSSSRFLVQSKKMSSMYLVKTSGLLFCVWRKSLIMNDIKMLAILLVKIQLPWQYLELVGSTSVQSGNSCNSC